MMDDKQYDNWKLDTPDNKLTVFCLCDLCDMEIYHGDEYYSICDGSKIHIDCFEAFARNYLDPDYRLAGQ